MKLWQKNTAPAADKSVEAFTVGRDREFDLLLARYDIMGSLAHVRMLHQQGLLTETEQHDLRTALNDLLQQVEAGTFVLNPEAEDIHSQVEWELTQRTGETGKKIHSGRSRNDQVLLDIKLLLRDELRAISQQVFRLFDLLLELSETHKNSFLPGYTHMQLAMPSSFGLWFGAYAESLTDDMELVQAAYRVCNRNPLGSGAGYGSSFPLNRQLTTTLLGFERMNYNVVYAQMTRGKTEKTVAVALAAVAYTLSKLASDVCLYLNQQFGFISFPDHLTTGSSIMPHKKNPDVMELVRARCNRIQSVPNELSLLLGNLPSGYHRDLQLTKEILFPALSELKNCLHMASYMMQHIQVRDHLPDNPVYDSLFSVEEVNQLVLQGIPFREAYRQVAASIADGTFRPVRKVQHTHEGSMGNLCTTEIRQAMEPFRWLAAEN